MSCGVLMIPSASSLWCLINALSKEMNHIWLTSINLFTLMREGIRSGRNLLVQIWQNCYEVRNLPSLVDIYRNDPHLVDFHKFVYPNEGRNQIW